MFTVTICQRRIVLIPKALPVLLGGGKSALGYKRKECSCYIGNNLQKYFFKRATLHTWGHFSLVQCKNKTIIGVRIKHTCNYLSMKIQYMYYHYLLRFLFFFTFFFLNHYTLTNKKNVPIAMQLDFTSVYIIHFDLTLVLLQLFFGKMLF